MHLRLPFETEQQTVDAMADSSQTQSSDHWVSSSSMITDASDVSDLQTNSLSSMSSTNSGFVAPSPPPVSHSPSLTSIERLEQENRVLKIEIETLKLRIKSLIEENKSLRRASVSIQAKAEQEEEFISNTLLKRIQVLKKEKETLALNYEHEEECLTNDLSRKLNQLRAEKVRPDFLCAQYDCNVNDSFVCSKQVQLERTLEQEQEALVNKLMRKIEKLEQETQQKQNNLEQLRREKIELENTLEQEQEALVNKLWKRMDKLESEKRVLQHKLEDYNKTGGELALAWLLSIEIPVTPFYAIM